MALAGRRVEVATEGNVAVGRVVDTVVDTERGFVAQRERVAFQVPNAFGGTDVVVGERLRAVRVPNWIPIESDHTRTAITGPNRNENDGSSDDCGGFIGLCQLFCIPCFLPCANKFLMVLWQVIIWIGLIVLTALTAAGPIRCEPLIATSSVTLTILGIIAFISVLCFCFTCCCDGEQQFGQCLLFCCTGICGILFLVVTITGTSLAFNDQALNAMLNGGCKNVSTNADRLAAVPIATMSFSYSLIVLFTCLWCCCCQIVMKAISNKN